MFLYLYIILSSIVIIFYINIIKKPNYISILIFIELIWVNIYILNIITSIITNNIFCVNFVFILFFIACIEFLILFFIILNIL